MKINDSDYLKKLEQVIESSNVQMEKISLTEEQKLMLSMSDSDILNDRIFDQESLEKMELEWLRREE